ncbi:MULTISPECIES: CD1871A family CXXC motif-containing protein, partial [Enterococcus]
DCASAGENQIRGCSLSRAIGAITPQHSQHLIIFVKKSVAIPTNFNGRLNGIQAMPETFFVDSNGETKVVLDKAIRICMECIGIG